MPDDVIIDRMALGGNEVFDNYMDVRFLPNGSCDAVEVLLTSESGLQLNIISDPLIGGARIETVGEAY